MEPSISGEVIMKSHDKSPCRLPIKAGNAGPTQSAQSSAATASKQAPSVPRVPGLHSTTQKKSPGSRQGPGLKGLNKKVNITCSPTRFALPNLLLCVSKLLLDMNDTLVVS